MDLNDELLYYESENQDILKMVEFLLLWQKLSEEEKILWLRLQD